MKSLPGAILIMASALALSACTGLTPTQQTGVSPAERAAEENLFPNANPTSASVIQQSSIFDLFSNARSPDTALEVNKYIWNAALEILDFMPIETVDPFSGVIVYGFGTPPGGGTAYRATVLINDPALDARSLNVALLTRNGAVDRETTRAVEDAILTRARELRIRDNAL